MAERSRTTPSGATRAEEHRDAQVEAGADETDTEGASHAPEEPGEGVAEHYEEMIERGAEQKGEGRLP
jgi:hypothetical protein